MARDFLEYGLEEDIIGGSSNNIGKPVGFRCSQPQSNELVHNTVLISYIDHGRGYKASHCKGYSKAKGKPKIERLKFHTKKDYEKLKKPTHLDWIYYSHKIHPGLNSNQKGFWYAYVEGSSKDIQVHNGIFDYAIVSINSAPTRIYDVKKAKKYSGKIIALYYTHYILDPFNPNRIVYSHHYTTSNQNVVDLGLLPTK